MKELLDQDQVTINGTPRIIGVCCMCGRRLSRSHLNKTGVRCYFDGAQYNENGELLYSARTEKTYRAIQKAKEMLDDAYVGRARETFENLIYAIESEELLP